MEKMEKNMGEKTKKKTGQKNMTRGKYGIGNQKPERRKEAERPGNRKPEYGTGAERPGNRKPEYGAGAERMGRRGPERRKDAGRGENRKPDQEKRRGAFQGNGYAGKTGTEREPGFHAGNKAAKSAGKKICRAFGDCGGCQLLGVPYEEQLAIKKRETAKLLKPYVKLEGMIGMEEPEHYRNKVNAAFTHGRDGKPLSGVYKEGTHYIIPVEECMLENKKADEIIASIRELVPSFKIKIYDEDSEYGLLRHVMVRVAPATGEIMVVLVLASPILPSKNNFVKALLKRHPEITTIVVNVNDRKTSMVLGDREQVIYGKGYIEDVLCGITFKISPRSFYQVNSVQTGKLYGKAMEYAGLTGKETVLDAYCGIGTIGMVAAAKAKKVIGVELNRDAVKDAVVNARKNKIANIAFYQKDAGEFMVQLAEQRENIDVVFMDPPRTGSDEVFLESLVRLKPKKVVYVSCNPETLARDLGVLVKKGYRAVKGVGVDMFPFCSHVETIVLLSRGEVDSKKIRVEFSLEDMDMSEFQDGATYPQIKEYVLEHTGLKVSNLYISQIKRKCGIEVGKNYNLPKAEDSRQPQCPPEKEKAIREAFKYFGMI